MKPCKIFLFGTTVETPCGRDIETRMRDFMFTGRSTESVDALTHKRIKGSPPVADYLLNAGAFVAELKNLTADPSGAVGRKLREDLEQAGIVVDGKVEVSLILNDVPHRAQVWKKLKDTIARRIRLNLKKANQQIGSTKTLFDLHHASGLVIMTNESVPVMGALAIASTLRNAFEAPDGGPPT